MAETGAPIATILVVGDGAAARQVPFAATCAILAVATASQAMVELAAAEFTVCLLDAALDDTALDAIVHAAQRRGVLPVLWAGESTPAAAERALALGCRAVVADGAGEERLHPLLAAAAEVRRRHRLEQHDLRDLESRYEALRRRTQQQAERFQANQETHFLDLSRVMTIISNIMDGIVFVDGDGKVTLLNPVAEDLLGVKAFVAVGKPLAALTGRVELLRALVADHEKLGGSREIAQTIEMHHSEQDLLYIKCITTRVLDYRGRSAGAMSVLKDVTAEYKSDQLKNQYLSIVAHELRTPLTGIKTFSTMMAKGSLGPLTDKQSRVVESIREQSLRLEHQIDKLINLGHLESDEYGQDREAFTVGEFAGGLLAPFEQPARDRQIALTFENRVPEAMMLHADRADLRRACQALVENAIKFTADGGAVDVKIVPEGDGDARFVVKDTGIGVDPRYQRRIFEKFFQVEDPLTRHHGGAGLGLFVAKGVVEAHGSRIEVSSQLGQGAEFSFVLPRLSAPAAAAAATAGQSA